MKSITYSVVFGILISCNSTPVEPDVKNYVAQEISNISANKIELIDFHKTNSQKRDVFGSNIYEIDFDGKIKYSTSGFATIKPYTGINNSFLIVKDVEPKPSIYETYIYHKPIQKGREEMVKGEVIYELKEKGWEPTKYVIKLANPKLD